MRFPKGTQVIVRTTGARGVVIDYLGPQIAKIQLDKGHVVRIHIDALQQAGTTSTSPKAISTSTSMRLGFIPHFGAQAWPDFYHIYLINNTNQAFNYRITLYIGPREEERWEGYIQPFTPTLLGRLYYDELNESPSFHIQFWRSTTAGPQKARPIQLRLRPKTFFKQIDTLPLLQKEGHWLAIHPSFPTHDDKEDLKQYTQKRAITPRQRQRYDELYAEFQPTTSPKDFATFVPEIDLHIEKLTDQSQKMNSSQILHTQLAAMEAFLEKAVRLGVPKVFLIHGIGKGRLRNEIATRLIQHPYVKHFQNEYHPRYGYGATEVFLNTDPQ